jgi:hypothetical protein
MKDSWLPGWWKGPGTDRQETEGPGEDGRSAWAVALSASVTRLGLGPQSQQCTQKPWSARPKLRLEKVSFLVGIVWGDDTIGTGEALDRQTDMSGRRGRRRTDTQTKAVSGQTGGAGDKQTAAV